MLKKMDSFTPIGIIIGLIAITLAIINISGLEGAVGFISFTAFLTVIGGLTASLCVMFSRKQLKHSFAVMKQAFINKDQSLQETLAMFVMLATKARREGILSLEKELDTIHDPYMKRGVTLAIDGMEQESIKDIMMAEIVSLEERHARGRQVVEKAGDLSPAWGMIGTIVGLVLMLQTLNQPETLGPKMAVALVTTFYGAILANLVFVPIAGKLKQQSEEEVFHKQIVIEAIIGIQSGQNPMILKDKLEVFLPPEEREELSQLIKEEFQKQKRQEKSKRGQQQMTKGHTRYVS